MVINGITMGTRFVTNILAYQLEISEKEKLKDKRKLFLSIRNFQKRKIKRKT